MIIMDVYALRPLVPIIVSVSKNAKLLLLCVGRAVVSVILLVSTVDFWSDEVRAHCAAAGQCRSASRR